MSSNLIEWLWSSHVISVLLVVPSTFVILAVYHIGLKPRVDFSEFIQVSRFKDILRQKYKVRVRKSNRRDLIELSVKCRLFVRDLNRTGKKGWTLYVVEATFDGSPLWRDRFRTVELKINQADFANESTDNRVGHVLRRNAPRRIPQQGYRFEDVFMAYPGSFIKLYIIGHDAITGHKYFYESKAYDFWSLQSGEWSGLKLK